MKLCELCGVRAARYVCQECGRSICERCIKPYSWLCLECHKSILAPGEEAEEILPIPFMKMFFLGFILMFAGVIILLLASLLSGLKISLGGIIMIGPIPIIFGAGENLALLIMLGVVLTIICLIIFLVLLKRGIRLSRI